VVRVKRLKVTVVLLAAAAALSAANLIRNGRFEDGLSGWDLRVDSVEGSWVAMTSPEFEPDIDREVLVEKLLRYSTTLSQSVALTTLDTRFAFRTRLYAYVVADTGVYHAYASVTLEYQDAAGTDLGRTMVLRKTARSPLVNTATRHLIPAPDEAWQAYEFVVRDELANLPGVNPAEVARVAVRLEAYGTGVGG
jgi:hypothetical protein